MPGDKSAWDSFWTGVWEGDFDREDHSWWKVIGQTLTGAVPYAGQVADVRDTLAAIEAVSEGREGGWTDLVMAGIGWIPAAGDFIKGSVRIGRKGAKAAANIAEGAADLGKHAPAPHVPHFEGKLKGATIKFPGVTMRPLNYVKRSEEATAALRSEFKNKVKTAFLKDLGNDPAKRAALEKAGLSKAEIETLAKEGVAPEIYQVHHKLPLDDGGTNSFDNLVLILHDPYHKAITNEQNALTRGMKAGESKTIDWPIPEGFIYHPKPN
jgi:hypothetical protein